MAVHTSPSRVMANRRSSAPSNRQSSTRSAVERTAKRVPPGTGVARRGNGLIRHGDPTLSIMTTRQAGVQLGRPIESFTSVEATGPRPSPGHEREGRQVTTSGSVRPVCWVMPAIRRRRDDVRQHLGRLAIELVGGITLQIDAQGRPGCRCPTGGTRRGCRPGTARGCLVAADRLVGGRSVGIGEVVRRLDRQPGKALARQGGSLARRSAISASARSLSTPS